PDDIQYASIYDSFTITVLMALEDLGFCEKGKGGEFVADGALRSPGGRLPFNTDGGGLCNNHPANRGGMTKVIEAVRQLRGEAHPAVQVPGCELALAHGTGGSLSTRHGSAPPILGGRGRRASSPPSPSPAAARPPRSGTPPSRAASCCPSATAAAITSGTRATPARPAATTRSPGPRCRARAPSTPARSPAGAWDRGRRRRPT